MRLAAADLVERLVRRSRSRGTRAPCRSVGEATRSSTRRRAAPPGGRGCVRRRDRCATGGLNRARSPRSDCSRPEGQVPAPGSDPLSRSRRRDGRARRGPRSARRPCRVGVARGSKCRRRATRHSLADLLARQSDCKPGAGMRPLSTATRPRTRPTTATDMDRDLPTAKRDGTGRRSARHAARADPPDDRRRATNVSVVLTERADPEDCAMRSIRIPAGTRRTREPAGNEERPRARTGREPRRQASARRLSSRRVDGSRLACSSPRVIDAGREAPDRRSTARARTESVTTGGWSRWHTSGSEVNIVPSSHPKIASWTWSTL